MFRKFLQISKQCTRNPICNFYFVFSGKKIYVMASPVSLVVCDHSAKCCSAKWLRAAGCVDRSRVFLYNSPATLLPFGAGSNLTVRSCMRNYSLCLLSFYLRVASVHYVSNVY